MDVVDTLPMPMDLMDQFAIMATESADAFERKSPPTVEAVPEILRAKTLVLGELDPDGW